MMITSPIMPRCPAPRCSVRRFSGRIAAAWMVLAAMPLLAGCRTAPRPAPGPEPVTATWASTIVYRADPAPGSSGPAFLLIEQAEPAAAGWVVRRSRGPAAIGPWTPDLVQSLVLTPDGHHALAEELNHVEEVELVFDPPLVISLAAADAPAPFEQSTRLRVHPLGRRDQIKAQGPVTQRIITQPADPASWPHLTQASRHITQHFTASLPPAQVVNTTHQWFDDAGRLLAERREEQTRVLIVQSRLNRESWIILDPAP